MTKTKQKYLVLKVVRVDEKNELYKNIYRVTDETEKLNLLGFYDEKETESVVILTNKTVLEYDWNGIAARVQKLNKEFCDQFVDKEKIIIITDEAKTEEVGQNFRIKDNIMFITEHRYNTQFKDENIIVEQPKVETVEEQPGIFTRIKKSLFPKHYKPKAPEEQYKTFVGELTEEEKFSAKHVWLGILFMIVLSVGFVLLDKHYSEKYEPTQVTQEFMDQITQTTTKVVFDSVKVDTIEIPDTILFNHDFQLNQKQQRILDSLAKERRYQDSVTLYLKLHRKVKVSLHSAINDGHTERTAKTKAVLEYLDRGSKPIIGKPGVQPNNGKETSFSMVPMVFPLPEAPERCITPKEEPKMTPFSQKADVKHMPATLKAIPGKLLSEAPVNSNFEVKKGPTYIWKSSGNTVKII